MARVKALVLAASVLLFVLGVGLACERANPSEGLAQEASSNTEGAATSKTTPANTAEKAAEKPPAPPHALQVKDRGIFPDLDEEVTLAFPSWVDDQPIIVMKAPGSEAMYAYLDGAFIGLGDASLGPVVQVESFGEHDHDKDLIPDSLDIMVGARKAELNSAPYRGGYEKLAYPGGDVARDRGVCTDVVVRAVRNAGVDLQVELHEDIKRSPRSFPMVKRADPNIDQRRVKTILPYFVRHWRSLPVDPGDASSPWLPGDILFMQIKGDKRPDHLGLAGDKLGKSGFPLVINNWTDGFSTSAIDILSYVPVTHRFRPVLRGLKVEASQRGLAGVLKRQSLDLSDEHRQVVLVTASHYNATSGQLRRYERRAKDDAWVEVGEAIEVVLGAKGLARGRGLHDVMEGSPLRQQGSKKEGDLRAPSGVFTFGKAFGKKARAPYASSDSSWPYRAVDGEDRFVDDPASKHYNSWQRGGAKGAWASSEAMSMYTLGVVVEHNMRPVKPGAGSAIFLHTTDMRAAEPTLGCTAMSRGDLERVLGWLDTTKAPVLVQVADEVF